MNLKKNELSTKKEKPATLADWLDSQKGSLGAVIPAQTINVERFMASAKMAIYNPKQPQLAQCTPESIYRSLKEAASLGLEIGGVLGQAYLIPYNESFKTPSGSWEKKMTCHFQLGYKGLIALARRSKTIKTIAVEAVYENDNFSVEYGVGRTLKHSFDFSRERGEVIAYYCLVELENDGIQFEVMTKKAIEAHRDKFSKNYKKDDSENNWNKNFDAMAKKTCVIQALKLCPISIEALETVRKEELADIGDDANVPAKPFNPDASEDAMYEVVEDAPSGNAPKDLAEAMYDGMEKAFDNPPAYEGDIF